MMEESSPAPPVGGKWYSSKTVLTSIVAFLLLVPSLVQQAAPFLNESQRTKALALGAIAATIASLFARKGGVQAAKAAAKVTTAQIVDAQSGKLLPGVLKAIGDKLETPETQPPAPGDGA